MRAETKRIGRELGRGCFAFLIAVALMIGLAVATRGRISNRTASLIGAATIAVYYLAALRWIERRHAPELHSKGRAREFGAGLVLGVGLFSSVMAVLWAIGVYQFKGGEHPPNWAAARFSR